MPKRSTMYSMNACRYSICVNNVSIYSICIIFLIIKIPKKHLTIRYINVWRFKSVFNYSMTYIGWSIYKASYEREYL